MLSSRNEQNFDEDYDEVFKGRRLRGFVRSVLEQAAALSDKNPEWANPILEQWANEVNMNFMWCVRKTDVDTNGSGWSLANKIVS
ncbi:hypothetical protein [Paenibacillus polymyxa]|uniref:hypothetical protein n=1 Tax=Paenibacillus polymyxa TaxID=1406 RepID=UPI002AB50D92|nr:hypothetical protein [Paenibacillus polymyxa]MDY8025597.1 hypothetical protein [Paenibacillus polymyxa]